MTGATVCGQLRHSPTGVVGVVAVKRRGASATTTIGSDWSTMDDYADLLTRHADLRAVPLPLTTADPDIVIARLRSLPDVPKALLLIGFDTAAATHVQRAVRGENGPVIITEADGLTAALGAAALTVLHRHGVTVRRGRIVITGTAPPALGPLLARLNAGVISSWHSYDAEDFPLRQVMTYHDVLVDLSGAASEDLAPGRTITLPESPYEHVSVALPGLLRGLCAHPHPRLDIDILAACSRGVALVTPAERMLPRADERRLVTSVAQRVQRALNHGMKVHHAELHEPTRPPHSLRRTP
ncbi:hypothetical protein [Mycolicibacterium tusciae]|uniref:hypothetical protein n=1 Tax=Mycolicibacterium tusciae TaxID=75922 RepID=UPI00024A365D|nr:hypothetical protein [Mycolicibacterium tusciae]